MPPFSARGAVLRLVGGTDITDRLERSSVLAAHLDYCRWLNLRPGTISQRRYALLRLARFHPTTYLLDITSEQIAEFRDRLTRAGQPLTAGSQAGELKHLAAFYEWALLEGLIDKDPMLRVPLPRVPKRLPHPIPEHELAEAIATAPDRIRPWFYLAAFAGLRASEIAPLRGEDLWWHHDPALVMIREQKGGDEGSVPMHPVLRSVFADAPRRGYLFLRHDGKPGPLRGHNVSHMANAHLHEVVGTSHTIHSCRHRFGTLVYRLSGGDLRMTQELMRHKSPVSTALYTEVDQSHTAGVVAALPVVEGAFRAA